MTEDNKIKIENWINEAHTVYPFNWMIARSNLFYDHFYKYHGVSNGLQLREKIGFENIPVFLNKLDLDGQNIVNSIRPAISVWMCDDCPYSWMPNLNTTIMYDSRILDPFYQGKVNMKIEKIRANGEVVGLIINQGFDEEGDFSFALFPIDHWEIAKFFGSEDPINKIPFPLTNDDETKYKILKDYGWKYLGLNFSGIHSEDLIR